MNIFSANCDTPVTALDCFHSLLKLTLTLALKTFGCEMRVSCRVLFWFGLIVLQDNLEALL